MKHHMSGLLVSLTMLFVACSAAALAATPKIPPEIVAPEPLVMAPPPGIAGPTENITKVAQAMTTRAKSLTTLVVVAPGVQLTQPVTISIAYYSPASNQRITQSYVASTGNHFLYNDAEGDGKPRQMNIHITFEEPNPAGGVYTFTWLMSVVLYPLYDVTISAVEFTLFTDCDYIGRSEIEFYWRSPDRQTHRVDFLTRAGVHTTIDAFAWGRAEVGAPANLLMPEMHFVESDPRVFDLFPHGFTWGPDINLVPGATRQVVTTLTETSSDQCTASVQYTITYNLRWYPFL